MGRKSSPQLSWIGVLMLLPLLYVSWSALARSANNQSVPAEKKSLSPPSVEHVAKPTVTPLEASHKTMVEAVTGGPVQKPTLSPRQLSAANEALNKYLAGFLRQDGESHRTTLEIAKVLTDYEIRGLSFGAPQAQFLTEADRLNGVEARLYFTVEAAAHRSKKPGGAWSEWKPGKPVLHFYGVKLDLRGGAWLVVSGPAEHYRMPEDESEAGIFRRRADGTYEKVN
jgi:hypothetical protein